jgi:predicted short-subunit dehydrogenase-like oxidoreductase (DUF2520 family)
MAEIAIIGAGRLGTALGRALAKQGHAIRALTCRSLASARESRRIIGQGRPGRSNAAAASRGNVIFLCLPDREIGRAAAALARARIDWTGKIVFHTSGLLPADRLSPLRERGAQTASFHPAQSFTRKDTPPAHFRGIYFGLEGDKRAVGMGRKMARQLGGHPLILRPEMKPLYHSACSLASNFLVVLLDAATRLLEQAGLEEKKAQNLLFPLVQGTLQNVKELNTVASLTGSTVRGDIASVKIHLEALGLFPGYGEAYRKLSLLALELARKRGLAPGKVRALKNLLEGK